ncbi:hypothetical protein JG688_00013294 [Phytophthora aleatoria]|uniref:Uncharacterized protein n=1 Tax=Phytophthora aleatoria TaxID=2496075 RepID=A0A8J5ME20_9STRA|nr:hypothetical protein JG688_00013294 [Phytophthora aleatoria]
MTPELPIARLGSQLQDDSESDASSLQRQNGGATSVEMNESDAIPTTENHNLWAMDDVEGVVMELLDDIAIQSAAVAIEKVVRGRLLGFVAAWGLSIIEDALVSAIAPTGDICVDSRDVNILNNSRILLGRNDLPLETLDPPRSCSLDYSYLRGQLPMKAPQRNHYDSEGLHHEVKAASRSHARPASIASSRMTMKSKMGKKNDTVAVELSGPQPGVPYSTEAPHSRTARHRSASPRKAMAVHHTEPDNIEQDPSNVAELQLSIDSEFLDQENGEPSRRSPSPSSIASARRRPHPPQNGRATKTFLFGERQEEVQVEYAVLTSLPRRASISSKSVLPNIENGRTKPRPNTAFGASSYVNHDKESLIVEEPLGQKFHAMPLSPGVKVRVGEEANDGPDLPHFKAQMRRSTFVRMETSILRTQISDPVASPSSSPINQINQLKVQPGKGTFLTETTWESSATDHDRIQHSEADSWGKSDHVSSTELTTSCSCDSTSSLTLFRRSTKVQRPCRSCNKSSIESSRTDTTNFSNLIKQRAFHSKPTCLPSSPPKRVPGASPRRVMSAPATSPLARRNLLLNNRNLDKATQII